MKRKRKRKKPVCLFNCVYLTKRARTSDKKIKALVAAMLRVQPLLLVKNPLPKLSVCVCVCVYMCPFQPNLCVVRLSQRKEEEEKRPKRVSKQEEEKEERTKRRLSPIDRNQQESYPYIDLKIKRERERKRSGRRLRKTGRENTRKERGEFTQEEEQQPTKNVKEEERATII